MAVPPLRGISVCSGVGGLDLGLKLALGDRYRTCCFIERNSFSASVLVARMEESSLDKAPIWDDLFTFESKPWRGVVDLVHGGIPCQPFSSPGSRMGHHDERWLWPDLWKVVKKCRAPYVFIENVQNIVKQGLPLILSDLARSGFHAEWDVFQAKQVGAPHRRPRFFLFAYANGEGLERLRIQRGVGRSQWSSSQSTWWRDQPKVLRVVDGATDRVDRSQAIGNAIVPAVAAEAWIELTGRALSR